MRKARTEAKGLPAGFRYHDLRHYFARAGKTVTRRSTARTPARETAIAGQGAERPSDLQGSIVGVRWLALTDRPYIQTCCGLAADCGTHRARSARPRAPGRPIHARSSPRQPVTR